MREGRHILNALCIVVLALVTLVGAGPSDRDGVHPMQFTPPQELREGRISHDGFTFERRREGQYWRVKFNFWGLAKKYDVSCRINIQSAQRLIERFGFRNSSKAAEIASRMERLAKEVADDKLHIIGFGVPRCSASFDETTRLISYTCSWIWYEGLPADAVEMSRNEFDAWYRKENANLFRQAERDFMSTHGFLYDEKQGWIIDYARMVSEASPILDDCVQAFHQSVGNNPEVLMNFFQTMPYILIKDDGSGWTTGGVRVPSSVLLQSEGDCDSKAATYCTLRIGYPESLVIFRSFRKIGDKRPGHALVGVEAFPSKAAASEGHRWPVRTLETTFYKDPVRVDNRYYIPCEVAGGAGRIEYGAVGQMRIKDQIVLRDQFVVIPIPTMKPLPRH
jgi:hypothetical protein